MLGRALGRALGPLGLARRRAAPRSTKRGAWSGPSRPIIDVGRRRQAARLRPFLQRASWRRARPRAPRRPASPQSAQHDAPRGLEAARRDTPPRSPPPSRRRAAPPSCARPPSISDRPSFSASPRSISRATSAQVSRRTSALKRGASRPSRASGSASSSASAITRPSTRSPRNSSRWLSPAPPRDPWVSARTSRSGRGNRGRAGRSTPAMARLELHSTALKKRSGRQVQKTSIDAPRRGEHHPVGAADEVLERARSRRRRPTAGSAQSVELSRLSPMKKIVALRHGEDAGVVARPSSRCRGSSWRHAARQRLDRSGRLAVAADRAPGRSRSAARCACGPCGS